MAELYNRIHPGNAITHLQAYGLPNPDFTKNARPSGDPRDRSHQGLASIPGYLAVRKVGFIGFTGNRNGTAFDFIVPSPDLRPDDKPRADITSLWVPPGAAVLRAGFRVSAQGLTPGANSTGPRSTPPPISGIAGTATNKIVLASAVPSAAAAGAITATAISTGSDGTALVVPTGGLVPVDTRMVSSPIFAPVVITDAAGLTLKLYVMNTAVDAPGGPLAQTDRIGGFIIAEVDYIVPDSVADMDDVHLAGALYGGTRG